MIPYSGSRLAVAAVLLLLQGAIFVLELLVFAKRVRRGSWYRPLRQLVGPVSIGLLVAILVPIMFANAGRNIDGALEQCQARVDGDIAGQGAQIAVWAQVGVLLIISMLGSFHTSATGAKEVGAGLVLTHFSLSIAILTQMGRGTLSAADAVVGAMILDAQNVGLSVHLEAKETLASRWQVGIVVLAQVFGLIVIPVLVFKFVRADFSNEECSCLTVFWWAWLSSCGQDSTATREMPVFWTYYACRCVGLCQTTFHSLYNTSKFDKAEKSERAEKPDKGGQDEERELGTGLLHRTEQQGSADNDNQPDPAQNNGEENRNDRGSCKSRCIRLRRVTYLYRGKNGQVACYREYPATVTLMYPVFGAFSLISLGTAQTTVTSFDLEPESPWIDSVGQIISLIVAAATLGRAAWLFLMLFRRSGKMNFVWPFKWAVAKNTLLTRIAGNWVLCFQQNHDPSFLTLGAILVEPFDATSQVGAEHAAPREVQSDVRDLVTFSQSSLSKAPGFESNVCEDLSARRLETSLFDPESPPLEPYIAARLEDPLIVTATNRPQAVYMVTGIKVAEGLSFSRHVSHNMLPSYAGAPVGAGFGASSTIDREQVLFAYRLHIFRWSRRRRKFVEDDEYQAEEDW
ncbi:hypothetical protein diail_1555 [Diaporthe ilicicola]|nr:hypothetical protein diail_1555 [Diaporthe ilicicola]